MAVFTCPLEYILSVGELFWNFFFSADPEKTLSFFIRTLTSEPGISAVLADTVAQASKLKVSAKLLRIYE